MADTYGDDECDYMFKAVLIGDSAVGKSNLLSRFSKDEFRLDSKPTIGVEFAYRNFKLGDKIIRAQIWDTAGQERFRAITSSYYRGAEGAVVVYDITRRATFESVRKWVEEVREFGGKEMVVVLVGNKSDLEVKREVAQAEGNHLAEKESLCFVETSALENTRVEEAFSEMITRIYGRLAFNKSTPNHAAPDLHLSVANGKQLFLHSLDEVTATKHPAICCATH